jgi:S-adenosylmethionine decarboxylase
MKNLAPMIYRKRLFIEGFYGVEVDEGVLRSLLDELCRALGMTPLTEPIIFSPTGRGRGVHRGLAAFMGWVESGVSIYTWSDYKFFTVDIYSCKEFRNEDVVRIVRNVLNAGELVYEEFRYEE